MKNGRVLNVYNTIIAIIIFLIIYFVAIIGRAFYVLTLWEKSWAVCDSINCYHRDNGLYPENWINIKTAYKKNNLKAGYGFDIASLETEIDVNFVLLNFINDKYPQIVQVPEVNRWIVKMKKYRNTGFEKEFYDNFFIYYSQQMRLSKSFEID